MENITLKTLQINIYDCIHPLMCIPEEMNTFLNKLVEFIGMTVISEDFVGQKNPNSFHYNPDIKSVEEYGISGSVILVESHIAAHSWYSKDFLNIVITSCKEYDIKMTILWIMDYCKSNSFKFDSLEF